MRNKNLFNDQGEYVDPKLIQEVAQKYIGLFDSKPEMFVFAPGRVNLIGEHTDYSDGFVFPLAIDMGILIAFTPRADAKMKLYSLDFEEYLELDISKFTKGNGNWQEYIKGIAWAIEGSGFPVKGFQGVFAGNLPIGAGLSSSAALEVAAAKAVCLTSDIEISNKLLAKICQKAECDWVGVKVGIMDQLISALGKSGYAMKLDCRTLETEYYPLPESICFVVMDTNTRRELTHSEYNTRHEEVKKAAQILGVSHLRDANLSLLNRKKDELPSVIYRRAKHVITENERVHTFGKAMEAEDLQKLGGLLNKSHKSLRDDFEVSSKELDIMVGLSQGQKGCYGARMIGAGFGGCALALIDNDHVNSFTKEVSRLYMEKTGIKTNIFKVESVNGVHAFVYDGSN
jgi:galactokinase